jgi:hypothetical protein
VFTLTLDPRRGRTDSDIPPRHPFYQNVVFSWTKRLQFSNECGYHFFQSGPWPALRWPSSSHVAAWHSSCTSVSRSRWGASTTFVDSLMLDVRRRDPLEFFSSLFVVVLWIMWTVTRLLKLRPHLYHFPEHYPVTITNMTSCLLGVNRLCRRNRYPRNPSVVALVLRHYAEYRPL